MPVKGWLILYYFLLSLAIYSLGYTMPAKLKYSTAKQNAKLAPEGPEPLDASDNGMDIQQKATTSNVDEVRIGTWVQFLRLCGIFFVYASHSLFKRTDFTSWNILNQLKFAVIVVL